MTASTSRANLQDNVQWCLGTSNMLLKDEAGPRISPQEQSMVSKSQIKGQHYFLSPYRTASQTSINQGTSDTNIGSKHWLGPPRSIPPDKRWQHISTYLDQSPTPVRFLPKNSIISGIKTPPKATKSLLPMVSRTRKKSLGIFPDHISLHESLSEDDSLRGVPSELNSTVNFASAPNTPSSHRKSVHFAPTIVKVNPNVRAVSTQNCVLPNENPAPTLKKVPVLYMPSTESIDQLPAVVEKYMVRSYPVLPAITPVSKVIYLNDGGNLNSPQKQMQTNKQRQRLRLEPPSQEAIHEVDENSSPSPKLVLQKNTVVKVKKTSLPDLKKPSPTNFEPKSKVSSMSAMTRKAGVSKKLASTATLGIKEKKATKPKTNKKSKTSPATTITSNTDESRCETPSTPDPAELERKRQEYEEMMKTVQTKMYEYKMRYGAPRTEQEEKVLEIDSNDTELLGSYLAGQLDSPTPPPPEEL